MGTLLDDGKYQVLENLFSEAGYAASICIDVETRNNFKPLIFNIYSEPDHISRFLPLFYGVSPGMCDSFRRLIPGSRCIMAVFDYHQGVPLIDHLKSLPKKDYPERAQIVGRLLDATLVLDMLPPIFAISALKQPNTVINRKENTIHLNFIIKPRTEPTNDEKIQAFIEYLENALVKNRYLPELAADFLKKASSGEITGFVQICAAWRSISAAAMEEYESYLKESIFKYLKRLMKKKAIEKREKVKEARG